MSREPGGIGRDVRWTDARWRPAAGKVVATEWKGRSRANPA